MLYFKVEVFPQRVQVLEVYKLSMYHHKASVDGDTWLYKVVKSKWQPPQDKGWFERAVNTIYWHANNSGNNVKFHEVHYQKRVQKSKRHEKQIALF